MSRAAGGLLQLISHHHVGIKTNVTEHAKTVYGKVHTTEAKSVDFEGDVATIPKFCDFVGDVHLKVVIPRSSAPSAPTDPFSLFDVVELVVKDVVTEALSVQWMHALDNGDVTQEPIMEESDDATVIVYPLRFALTEAWVPNIQMREVLPTIRIKGSVLSPDTTKQLIVTAIYLTEEQRSLACRAPPSRETLLWIRKTQVEKAVEGEVDITLSGDDAIRELIVVVSSERPTQQPLKYVNCVSGGVLRHDISDPLYYQKVVPRTLYHIDNVRPMYYITLDPTPLADACTSLLYTKAVKKPTSLKMQLVPGKHDVYILTRVLRRMSFSEHGCVLKGIIR